MADHDPLDGLEPIDPPPEAHIVPMAAPDWPELVKPIGMKECVKLTSNGSHWLYVLERSQADVEEPKAIVLDVKFPAGKTLIVVTSCYNTYTASLQAYDASLNPPDTKEVSRFVPNITVSLKTQPEGTIRLINAIDLERVFLSLPTKPKLTEFLDQMRVDSPQMALQAYRLWTLVDTSKRLDLSHNAVTVKHLGRRTYIRQAAPAANENVDTSKEPVTLNHHSDESHVRHPYIEAKNKLTEVDFSLAFINCSFKVDNIVMSQCLSQQWDDSRVLYVYLLTPPQEAEDASPDDIYQRTIYHNVRILHLPLTATLVNAICAASTPLSANAISPPLPTLRLMSGMIQEKIWFFPDARSGNHAFWNDVRNEDVRRQHNHHADIPVKTEALKYCQPFAFHDQHGPTVLAVPQRVAESEEYFQEVITSQQIVQSIKFVTVVETNLAEDIFNSDHGEKYYPTQPRAVMMLSVFAIQLPRRTTHNAVTKDGINKTLTKTHFIYDFNHFVSQMTEGYGDADHLEKMWVANDGASVRKWAYLRRVRIDHETSAPAERKIIVPFTRMGTTTEFNGVYKDLFKGVICTAERVFCVFILDNGDEDAGTDYRVSVKNVAGVRNLRTYHVHRDYVKALQKDARQHFTGTSGTIIDVGIEAVAVDSPKAIGYTALPPDRVKFVQTFRRQGEQFDRRQFVAFVGLQEKFVVTYPYSFPKHSGEPTETEPWDLLIVRHDVYRVTRDRPEFRLRPQDIKSERIFKSPSLSPHITPYDLEYSQCLVKNDGKVRTFGHTLRKFATPVFDSNYDYPADRAMHDIETYFRNRDMKDLLSETRLVARKSYQYNNPDPPPDNQDPAPGNQEPAQDNQDPAPEEPAKEASNPLFYAAIRGRGRGRQHVTQLGQQESVSTLPGPPETDCHNDDNQVDDEVLQAMFEDCRKREDLECESARSDHNSDDTDGREAELEACQELKAEVGLEIEISEDWD